MYTLTQFEASRGGIALPQPAPTPIADLIGLLALAFVVPFAGAVLALSVFA